MTQGPNVYAERLSFHLPLNAFYALKKKAGIKGISTARYARRLIEIVCRNNLFDAVDDGVDEVPKKKPKPPKGVNGGGRQRLFVSSA
jgi:hypothetical protein